MVGLHFITLESININQIQFLIMRQFIKIQTFMLIVLSTVAMTLGAQSHLEVEGNATIDSTLGIGTPASLYPLAIKAAANSTSIQFRTADDTTSYHINTYGDRLEFRQTGQTFRPLTIKDGEKIGIGTVDPQATLDVDGEVRVNKKLWIRAASGETPILRFDRFSTGYDAELRTDASYMTLFGGANGTGTTLKGRVKLALGDMEASLTTDGLLQLGLSDEENIVIDANEIIARDSGALSGLSFQDGMITMASSGSVGIGGNGIIDSVRNAMTVLKGGNVGINTAHPDQLLTISKGNDPILRFDRSDPNNFDFEMYMNSADLTFRGGKNNTGLPVFVLNDLVTFHANGDVTITGALTENSDARLKKNIIPLSSSLPSLMAISGYTYDWKDESRSKAKQIGLLAQEVQTYYPELVRTDDKGTLSVNYSGMVPILVEGMKEQQSIIDNQKSAIEQLQSDNMQLESRLRKIEELLSVREEK